MNRLTIRTALLDAQRTGLAAQLYSVAVANGATGAEARAYARAEILRRAGLAQVGRYGEVTSTHPYEGLDAQGRDADGNRKEYW